MLHRLVVPLTFVVACGAQREAEPGQTPRAELVPAASLASPVPALSASASDEARQPSVEIALLDLPVPGYEPAVVVTSATGGPAPVVVVTHGAGGSPEPHCARYAALAKGRGFVLCTRGRPMDKHLPVDQRGHFYDGHHELGREVIAALGALVERFGARVDPAAVIYTGYSQGAAMGILYLQQGGAAAAQVGRILLVEGGAGDWSIGLAAKLKKEGVAKVAIVCGQATCHQSAKKSLAWIQKGGLDARVAYAAGAGHTYGGAVVPVVDEAWAWLTEDDPRWSSRL